MDDGGVRCGVFAFQERKAGTPGTKLHVMDILKNRGESAPPFKACEDALVDADVQVQQEIQMPPEAPTDFAVGLHLSEKHGVVFMITKVGSPT